MLSPAAIGVFLIVVGIVAAFALRSRHASKTEIAAKPTAQLLPVEPAVAPRTIFPLSVIHGGAYSREELARARRNDSVVAAHYAGFGSAPQFQKLAHNTLMYVSYRRGDQVYWSKIKHLVRQGETVISDGNCMARARCGNRLSATPQTPVAPKEPGEEILNTPEIPDEPVSYKLAELPGPAGRPFVFNIPSNFAPDGQTPAVPVPARAGGVPSASNAPANYFASGPGGAGGGYLPATAGNKSASATVPTQTATTTLPAATTGGSTLPASSTYPVPVPPPGGLTSDTNAELVPEPAAFGYFLLVSVLFLLGSLRRFRSGILRR